MTEIDGTPVRDARPLTEMRALVTGGSTGIGRAVVRALLRAGARVVTCARDEEDLAAALAEMRREPGEVHGLTADVSRLEDVRRIFAEVDARFGGLDLLVNNAAITGESFVEDPLERIEYVIRTNVVGYLACAHEAVARMQGAGGRIVLIGSMSADLREPEGSSYVASKGAIQAFAESLRKTLGGQEIRVTLVEPGKVATDMVRASPAEKREKVDAGEMLEPEDVAGVVLYALMQPPRCDVVALQLRPHNQVI